MYWLFYLYFGTIAIISMNLESAQKSVSGEMDSYLDVCNKSVTDPVYFKNFRSLPEYFSVVECAPNEVFAFGRYLIENASPETLQKMPLFENLDRFGSPTTFNINELGVFSSTTLRYILIGDQILKFFKLPRNAKIAEIGAGFGGQAYVLSHLLPWSAYYIFDLAEPESLILKMAQTLKIHDILLIHSQSPLPEEKIDLLISNYAFSECDRATQLDYFDRVLKKATCGYILFNPHWLHSFDSLSSEEFVALLNQHEMNPMILEEPVNTYPGNLLIIWNKSKPID
jgi:hypothetical protein